ncbi:hypothetical protein [Chryseobacterium sp. 5_R23647]|uniref:hypothetical protein n=1 Tax=Chryseobacterium sp. 5_R23647 TaxID=2258964 RepID=UPI000E23663C|nr:hypothetical protein [Chryseobacterium sp. 5_R23647]REC45191.1 hypothetical protein DRF69_04805 [Chryseobacterium sp. 5_R23647]
MKNYKSLLIDKPDDYYLDENDEITPIEFLPFVNNINIFIGTNNSGKSKFMRKLMSLKKISFLDENALNLMNENIIARNKAKTHGVFELLKRGINAERDFNHVKSNYWFKSQVPDCTSSNQLRHFSLNP